MQSIHVREICELVQKVPAGLELDFSSVFEIFRSPLGVLDFFVSARLQIFLLYCLNPFRESFNFIEFSVKLGISRRQKDGQVRPQNFLYKISFNAKTEVEMTQKRAR